MSFIADLHIHSRFSMATSASLTIPELTLWGRRKGIGALASGDFTHPVWLGELKEFLLPDEASGLFKASINVTDENMADAAAPLFMLGAEISCVYKKGGKTRKVHNLVFVPRFEDADKLIVKLSRIGKLESDGRPILKLDSRDLLEMLLEVNEEAVLIPAHIWTPWYSLFGSRSGFDSIQECYGDLTSHIFALETGLSSDPAMNRHWSALDGFALVSNSDAHSGANLGREGNLFTGRASWNGIFEALRRAAKRERPLAAECEFLGTLEFFPEEGKYHLDGHRNCGISLEPWESEQCGNICPVCGKPLTIGVLHRVLELSDRNEAAKLENEPHYASLVPLTAILAEILGAGSSSRKVRKVFLEALAALGPELDILWRMDVTEIRDWWEPLGEAIARVRAGEVDIRAGFDGEYGKISIFSKEELRDIQTAI